MSKTKTQLRFYDVMDYEKEAAYLSEMHGKGWKFSHVHFPGLYHFVQCQPAKVQYQLDYNKDGIRHKDEYTQIFEDCGWEYLMDFAGYSYFRKPVAEGQIEEDIFCDEDSRFDMVKRIFRGRIIPLLIIFIAFIIPVTDNLVHTALTEGEMPIILIVELFVIVALYLSIFIRFTMNYIAFKRRIGR